MEDTRQQFRSPKPAYHILPSQPSVDQETDNSISLDRTYRTYVRTCLLPLQPASSGDANGRMHTSAAARAHLCRMQASPGSRRR